MSDLMAAHEEHERKVLESLYRYEDRNIAEGVATMLELAMVPPGMMFMYFDYEGDPRDGKFVNPLDVRPELSKDKAHELSFDLITLHVDDLIDSMRLSRRKPLEHRLFTRVPLEGGADRDWLEWIVSSAIEVFLQSDRQGRDKKLQAFVEGSTPTSTLKAQEAIVIGDGRISMGQGIWGHGKKNFFSKFWGALTKAFSSPLVAAAGLPALVPTAARFVNKVLADHEEQARLRTLWQTKRLPFKIDPTVPGTPYGLRAGYWAVVESEYVQQNPNLEDHVVDFEHQSFEILDARERPIDAAYLVGRVDLTEK